MPEKTPHKPLRPIDPLISHLLSNEPYNLIGSRKLWEAIKNLSDGLRHKEVVKAAQIDVAELAIPDDIGLKLLIPPTGLVAPPPSGWLWINQGTASVSLDSNGRITLRAPTVVGFNHRIRVRPAPSTPYIITTASYYYTPDPSATTYLLFRDSVSGRLVVLIQDTHSTSGAIAGGITLVQRWNSPTSFNSTQGTTTSPPTKNLSWRQIEDDGTTIYFRVSPDGVNWVTIHSESRTAWLTNEPLQVGFSVISASTLEDVLLTILHWVKT